MIDFSSHPVIRGVEKKLSAFDHLDDLAREKAVQGYLREMFNRRDTLLMHLNRQESEDPAQLNPRQIDELRDTQLACAFLQSSGLDSRATQKKLESIVNGVDTAGGPSTTKRFSMARERALAAPSKDRISAHLD